MEQHFSWSRLETFNKCSRRYELAYVEGLEKKPTTEKKALINGSCIHAGIDAFLRAVFVGTAPKLALSLAVAASREELDKHTIQNKTIWNWEKNCEELDYEYFSMIEELYNAVPTFLRYHLPLLDIGEKYQVASIGEVYGHADETPAVPAVELEFEKELADGIFINGRVDAVLREVATGELVIFDWKSRKAFPRDDVALLDGQLHLYAAVLNKHGAKITKICMAQMRTGLPKPAELSTAAKTLHQPLTGRSSYDSTWEVWAGSLPVGINAEDYRAEMQPKMKLHEPDYYRPVFGFCTPDSDKLTIDNTLAQIKAIQLVVDNEAYSGVYMYRVCEYCPFQRLCANGLRYGGNVAEVIERDYFVKPDYQVVKEELLDE